jgi:hypothetical protein
MHSPFTGQSSWASNATAGEDSSGGKFALECCNSGDVSSIIEATRRVNAPGLTALTLIPKAAPSAANDRVSDHSPPLLVP